MKISIKLLSTMLSKSPKMRKIFTSGIKVILYILEQQRLVDFRKLEQVSINWDKGHVNLGDNFVEMVTGRAIGEYVVNKYKKSLDYKLRSEIARNTKQETLSLHDQ